MLTIFTPTYNREKLLERAYQSLLAQTSQDFVWLIVDDGSVDNTKTLVEQWQNDNQIAINYIFQENGGKMRAHNTGVRNCETELFLCLDSDDYLVKTAVEDVLQCFFENKSTSIAGIVAHKGESDDKVLFNQVFPDIKKSTLRALYRGGFSGETTLIFKTEILKKYLFPEILGEKYVPEDYIYDKIDEDYKLIILPKILTICELVEEGYTNQAAKLRKDNPTGWYLYYEQRARLESFSLLKIKYISHYICFAKFLKKNIYKETTLNPVIVMLGIPGAIILAIAGKM